MIYRKEGVERHDYWLIDCGSTCGTYLNEHKLDAPTSTSTEEVVWVGCALADGSTISLGPSGINTFYSPTYGLRAHAWKLLLLPLPLYKKGEE
jgi:hypothetical protein